MKYELYSHLRPSLDKKKDRSGSKDTHMRTESRIGDIQYGVDTLTEAWEALKRSFAENLKGPATAKIAELMLSEIELAVKQRFSIVDKSLKVDQSADGIGGAGSLGILLLCPTYQIN